MVLCILTFFLQVTLVSCTILLMFRKNQFSSLISFYTLNKNQGAGILFAKIIMCPNMATPFGCGTILSYGGHALATRGLQGVSNPFKLVILFFYHSERLNRNRKQEANKLSLPSRGPNDKSFN